MNTEQVEKPESVKSIVIKMDRPIQCKYMIGERLRKVFVTEAIKFNGTIHNRIVLANGTSQIVPHDELVFPH